MKALSRIYALTLNNVKFGILLMVLIAAYVAVGSGLPRVREHFEMDELGFFNAWPFAVLIGLFVASMLCVTFERIPFTPPRYGVWMVHAGFITLAFGLAYYYTWKVEGLTLIPVGQSVSHFYDSHERALYARVGDKPGLPVDLPGLPRFAAYDEEFGNAAKLDEPALRGASPTFYAMNAGGSGVVRQGLGRELGVDGPVTVDVVGYYPYANVERGFVADPSVKNTGVMLSELDEKTNRVATKYLVAGDPAGAAVTVGPAEMEHRALPDATAVAGLADAALHLHRAAVTVGGEAVGEVDLNPGETATAGGYTFAVEDFNPAFPLSGTGEPVPILTMLVTAPDGGTFRRMVISGRPDIQTDFEFGGEGAGPMGRRQKAPIDPALVIDYAVDDPLGLLPKQSTERHVFATAPGETSMTEIAVALDRPPLVTVFPDGSGDVHVHERHRHGPMEQTDHDDHETVHVLLARRRDGVRQESRVTVVPPEKRDRDAGASGDFQVVRVRVNATVDGGDWSSEVLVPFGQFPDLTGWDSAAVVRVPGADQPLKLMLGNLRREMPARITLKQFDLVPYPGGGPAAGSTIMRDFRSTLVVEDRRSGAEATGVASMNSPVYFGSGAWGDLLGGQWLFFQARWDQDGQKWTILGVGNRPGVTVMIAGCLMVAAGLMYAFYAKPVVIRAMKRRALAKAGLTPEARRPRGKRKSEHPIPEDALVAATH